MTRVVKKEDGFYVLCNDLGIEKVASGPFSFSMDAVARSALLQIQLQRHRYQAQASRGVA